MHLACNGRGKPVAWLITGGNIHDVCLAPLLINACNHPNLRQILADTGYVSKDIRACVEAANITYCVPDRKNAKVKNTIDTELYKKRWRVEACFAKLKNWRRIATRYDKSAQSFLNAVTIAILFSYYLI
ncbi:IS5 family transposase [Pseudochelatococcus sp. G4_1912]